MKRYLILFLILVSATASFAASSWQEIKDLGYKPGDTNWATAHNAERDELYNVLGVSINPDGTLKSTTSASTWIVASTTATYIDADSFKVPDADGALFETGRKVLVNQTADVIGVVGSTSSSGGETTVNLTNIVLDSDNVTTSTLTSPITSVSASMVTPRNDTLQTSVLITDIQNLSIKNNTGTPTTQLDISATLFYKNSKVTVSATLNAATTGANGLDTGSLAVSTAYSIYFIEDGTNVKTLLSTNHTDAPTYPSGYTNARWIGGVVTTGSSQFRSFKQLADKVWFDAHEQVATGLTATVYTTQSLASVIPTATNRVRAAAFRGTSNTATNTLYLSDDGVNVNQVMYFDLASTDLGDPAFVPINGDNIYYKVSANSLTLYTLGYEVNP